MESRSHEAWSWEDNVAEEAVQNGLGGTTAQIIWEIQERVRSANRHHPQTARSWEIVVVVEEEVAEEAWWVGVVAVGGEDILRWGRF